MRYSCETYLPLSLLLSREELPHLKFFSRGCVTARGNSRHKESRTRDRGRKRMTTPSWEVTGPRSHLWSYATCAQCYISPRRAARRCILNARALSDAAAAAAESVIGVSPAWVTSTEFHENIMHLDCIYRVRYVRDTRIQIYGIHVNIYKK